MEKQMKNYLRIVFIALLILSNNLCAQVLKTAAQDSAPKFIKKSPGTVTGLSIDVMQAISRIDPTIKFNGDQTILPFKRIETLLESGELDVFFGFIKNKERQEKYNFIDPPIYMVADVLVARIDDPVNIKSLDELKTMGKDGTVLMSFGIAQVNQFTALGITVDDSAQSLGSNLKKLISNRGRFVFQSEIEVVTAIKEEKLEDKLRILPVRFNEGGRYIAFSKKVPATVIAKIKSALEKLEQNGELKKIKSTYF
jgi:polar amino acid transport system substrate-binding protein